MDEALKPYTPVLLYTHMFTGSTKSQEISSTPEKRRLFIGRIMSKMTISEEDDQFSRTQRLTVTFLGSLIIHPCMH